MIFVTVGTHEQPFNRLVKHMDKWAAEHEETVVIQTGFSTYEPKNCQWKKLFTYQEMINNVAKARIVITHGGPSSFIMPLQIGKIPVVVPRREIYKEHVNDHQIEFAKAVAERQGNIIVVEDVDEIDEVLAHYEKMISSMSAKMRSNNNQFCTEFAKIVNEIIPGEL